MRLLPLQHLAAALLLAAPAWAQTDIRPDATISVSNSTCDTSNAHTTLDDDPNAPTNDWCDAVADGTDHDLMIRFALPGANLVTTAEAQTFAVYTRRSATGGTNPSVALDAYRGTTCATLVENNTGTTITSDTGQLIADTWGADTSDGSEPRCVELDCARSGGPTGDRRSCDYDAVEWRAVLVSPGGRHALITRVNLKTGEVTWREGDD